MKNTKKTITVEKNTDKTRVISEFSFDKSKAVENECETTTVNLYIAKITKSLSDAEILSLYPIERVSEILSCGSEKAKREKFSVWKLLEFAVSKVYGLDLSELKITKTENGKWICDKFNFSLSHSDDAVAVALSKRKVGVDIQAVKHTKERAIEKYLNDAERKVFETLLEQDKQSFLLKTFSAKESIFKLSGEKTFLPTKRNTLAGGVRVEDIEFNGQKYILSVCSESLSFNLETTVV